MSTSASSGSRRWTLTRQIGDAISAMRRVPPDDSAGGRELGIHLQILQRELATLRSTLG